MGSVNHKWLTPKELAARWGWHVNSLANQRARKQGPKFERIGRAVLYCRQSVMHYELAHPEVMRDSR